MSFFTVLVTSKIAAGALAAGTVVVGGTATAAYTGSLPEPLQQSAHDLLGAPAPAASAALAQASAEVEEDAADAEAAEAEAEAAEEAAEAAAEAAEEEANEEQLTENESAGPVGPDATGPAAYGLCQSFSNGGLDVSSIAYESLAAAADGETNITTYCATVVSPGESANHLPAEIGAGAAAAHIPAAPQQAVIPALPQQAVVPPTPQVPPTPVVPAAPQQAVVPPAPQVPPAPVVPVPEQAENGPANKPAPAGRP